MTLDIHDLENWSFGYNIRFLLNVTITVIKDIIRVQRSLFTNISLYLGIISASFSHKKKSSRRGFIELREYLKKELNELNKGIKTSPIVVVFLGSVAAGKTLSTVFTKRGGLGLKSKDMLIIRHD